MHVQITGLVLISSKMSTPQGPQVPLLRPEMTSPCAHPRLVALLAVPFVLVEFIYVTKGALLITKYSHPAKLCPNSTGSELVEGDDSAEIEGRDRSYYFTVAVYTVCSLLRCIEYIPLFAGWHRFCKNWSTAKCKLEHSYRVIWFFLAILAPLPLSIPAVGIALQVVTEEKKHCGNSLAAVFFTYCAINFFRYLWAASVRVGMVIATLKIRELWSKFPDTSQWCSAVQLHAKLTNHYIETGKQVQEITGIFQTWFLFPWINFFLASSLEANNILWIWDSDKEEVETLPVIYFLLYNIIHMVGLLVPYLCGQKMDSYHHHYHMKMQEAQLDTSRDKRFRAEQRKMLIQEEDNYNFVPRVWGLSIKVKMNSLIYIIFLLVGLFFTLFGATM